MWISDRGYSKFMFVVEEVGVRPLEANENKGRGSQNYL